MYKYVYIDNLNIHLCNNQGKEDIYIWSSNIAKYFNIPHHKLLPILNLLSLEYPLDFTPHKRWNETEKQMEISLYTLNKEACNVLCKRIEASKSLKKRFINLIFKSL